MVDFFVRKTCRAKAAHQRPSLGRIHRATSNETTTDTHGAVPDTTEIVTDLTASGRP
jgi:hypothetical protein